jgi:hypothetical protein
MCFTTDSSRVEIVAQLIALKTEDRPVASVGLDLVVDGKLVGNTPVTDYHIIHTPDRRKPDIAFIAGSEAHIALALPGDGAKHEVEIWLPHNAGIEIRTVSVDDNAVVEESLADTRRKWMHYGSSISHCIEAITPHGVWSVVAADKANVNLYNLGLAGECQLDQFSARVMRDSDADLLSMKVGINVVNLASMRDRVFIPALHGFIDTVREKHAHTPFVVASPIFCPPHETGFGPSVPRADIAAIESRERPVFLANGALSLTRIREIVREVVEQRREAGDHNLHYLDGLDLFGEADQGDLPDLLHPNADGYRRMGERFHSLVFENGPFRG